MRAHALLAINQNVKLNVKNQPQISLYWRYKTGPELIEFSSFPFFNSNFTAAVDDDDHHH